MSGVLDLRLTCLRGEGDLMAVLRDLERVLRLEGERRLEWERRLLDGERRREGERRLVKLRLLVGDLVLVRLLEGDRGSALDGERE